MKDIFNFILKFRREIHSFPELSFKEYKTQERIAKVLKKFNIKFKKIANTGIISEIGSDSKKKILLRADIDALPVEEKNKFPYVSKNKGVMHACGHDFNTAMVLGTALLLKKENFNKKVYFLFQPAEEQADGAEFVLKDKNFPKELDFVFGVHIEPFIKTGYIGVKEGVLMANVDKFKIEIQGKGGHAAYPDKCINPIGIFSSIYSEINKIVSEKISPLIPAVVTITKVNSGERFNIIPEKLVFEGTVRTIDNKTRKKIFKEMKILCRKFSSKSVRLNLEYEFLGEALYNDRIAVKFVKEAVKKTGLKIFEVEKPSLGGEDFSLYLKKFKGAYVYVGGGKKEKNFPWHSPNFSPDEKAIENGIKFLSSLVKLINK